MNAIILIYQREIYSYIMLNKFHREQLYIIASRNYKPYTLYIILYYYMKIKLFLNITLY